MADKYLETKVADVGALKGPANGIALVVRFEKPVEVNAPHMEFPLDEKQFYSLFKVMQGFIAERKLEQMQDRKLLHIIGG